MIGKRSWQILVWYFEYRLNAVGWQHVAAIGLLTFGVSLAGVVDYPMYVETRRLATELAARNAPKTTKRASPAQSDIQRDIAKEFVNSLPEFDKYPEQLRILTQLAEKNAVVILRVDYRYEYVPTLTIRKIALHLDLKGDEVQQKRLLRLLLNTFSNLSIVRLAYTKNADPGASVEQKLDVNLYYRSDKGFA
jgi:hypothetical protein